MKKITLLLLSIIFVFSLLSCNKSDETRITAQSIKYSENEYIKAPTTEYTDEERKIIDEYYLKMIERYPSFGEIPREMLREYIHQSKYMTVSFVFCLGGIVTGCTCEFRTSKTYPEGRWEISENEFAQYYKNGLTEEQMKQIRKMLCDEINEYIDSCHLEKNDNSEDDIYVTWQAEDGKIYASCEAIANTTLLTFKKYGCGDHAHIFARVQVEISDECVNLTPCETSGS